MHCAKYPTFIPTHIHMHLTLSQCKLVWGNKSWTEATATPVAFNDGEACTNGVNEMA